MVSTRAVQAMPHQRHLLLVLCLPLLLLLRLPRLRAAHAPPTTVWDTLTPEPSANKNGKLIIGGGMPVGNGELLGLVFPVARGTAGADLPGQPNFDLPSGVSFMVDMQTAMGSDTSLLGVGMVTLETHPRGLLSNVAADGVFVQTLHAANGSVTVRTSVATVTVWVDANSNHITATLA